jgi:hypothetical protein
MTSRAIVGANRPGVTLLSCVERSAWTDERLDDLAARGDSQFELLRTEMRDAREEFRAEMREMREEFRAEMREFRVEMREFRTDMREMRAEMHAGFTSVRRDMFHGAVALFGTLAAMVAAMFVHALG